MGLFDALGVKYLDGSKIWPTHTDFTIEENKKMSIAISSTIISSSRRVRPNTRLGVFEAYLKKRLTSQSQRIFSLTTQLIKEFSASKVFILNGRFAAEHATYLAAQREDTKTVFYEASAAHRRHYVTDYRIHDRITSQSRVPGVTSSLQDSELQAYSNDVSARNKGVNLFGSLWAESRDTWKGPRDSLALFATSSQDEMASLDLTWNEASWESQFQAFLAVWGKLKSKNLTPVLRIHPNLLNKSPISAHREIKEIRRFESENPEFYIIWPASDVSTYDLISYSDVVVVESSTVGVEASAEGVPVICTNSCAYDIAADVVTVHGPEDLGKIDAMPKNPDPRGAQRFIAFEEMIREPISSNEFGVAVSNLSKINLLIPSIIEGSIYSLVFELRWKIYRIIMLKTCPRD